MQITKSKIQHFSTLIFILVVTLLWVLMCGDIANAGSYTDSAHSKTSYGVSRSDTGYARGDCVNCHDSCDNEFMLFAPLNATIQNNNFCFQCHKGSQTQQTDWGRPYRCYDRRHGGYTSITCPKNAKKAFMFVDNNGQPSQMCGSSVGLAHFLPDIKAFLEGGWGWGTVVQPCEGCHNPHAARRNWPCSLPSNHANPSTWKIWGNNSGEKMCDYVDGGFEKYQAPLKYGGSYEWESANIAPDYNTLCLECHQYEVSSTRRGTLDWIPWDDTNYHGKRYKIGTPYYGGHLSPFTGGPDYVLMCTDCHDPHGSPNEYLLRTCVNGKSGITVPGSGKYMEFCTACHWLGSYHGSMTINTDCRHCHGHWITPIRF